MNRAIDDYYLRVIRKLKKVMAGPIPGASPADRYDNAKHCVIMLGRCWPLKVSAGRSVNPVAEIDELHAIHVRDIKRAREQDVAARAAAKARLIGGGPKPPSEGFQDGYVPLTIPKRAC